MKVALALFPELGVTAYTLDDLFLQSVILESAKNAISVIVSESKNINTILVIGSPLKFDDKIFNCALAVSYTHLRAHETVLDLVCRLLLEKKKNNITHFHTFSNTHNIE